MEDSHQGARAFSYPTVRAIHEGRARRNRTPIWASSSITSPRRRRRSSRPSIHAAQTRPAARGAHAQNETEGGRLIRGRARPGPARMRHPRRRRRGPQWILARGASGLAALLLLAWLFSENRRRIPWRTVIAGVVLQFALALLLLRVPPAARSSCCSTRRDALAERNRGRHQLRLRLSRRPPLPFAETHPGASFILAFQALPLVLTISALASLLFHWGVLQRITAGFRLAAAPRDGHRRRAWRWAPRCMSSSA